MRLLSVSVRTGADTVRIVAEAESGSPSRVFELYFEYPIAFAPFVSPAADSFAAAMLIPAMRRGEPLHITPPLSPRLLFHLPRIRDIIHTWHPELTRSAIHATPGPVDPAPPPNRAATFFSGGIDSFYTLLKGLRHEPLPAPLTHVVFMRGLEKPLDFMKGVEAAQALVQQIGAPRRGCAR